MQLPLPPALAQAIARERETRAARALSPLFPFLPAPGARLGTKQAVQLAFAHGEAQAWEAELLRQAGAVQRYLGWDYADLCEEAQRIPRHLVALSGASAPLLLQHAQRLFGEPVPGATVSAQLARALDPRYWRRTLWRRIGQAKEKLHLQMRLVGKGARQYCSADALTIRRTQLAAQKTWMDETLLRADIEGEYVELALAKVAKGADQKLARLYAFIAAMDRLAEEADLTVALLTATLEGEWHANPLHAKPDHRWNGKSPGEANKELGARFQHVRRDLDKKGIAVSGLWAAEPHQDGCPHRHFWLIYDPEHEASVFAAFLRYFPGKLKLRRKEADGGDVIIETSEDALAGKTRPLAYAKEGVQVDVSVIDRTRGSGASYVLKYVRKAITTEATYADLLKPVAVDEAAPAADKSRPRKKVSAKELRKELRALQTIDAYRAVWRMRSFQFFGIRNCLTLWDELRRIQEAPQEAHLRELWRLARGGEAEGPLKAGQQHGDAYGFLVAQGGLAAARKCERAEEAPPAPFARLYRSARLTQYGEPGSRIEGVELVQRAGEEVLTLARVATRGTRWELVAKQKKKAQAAGRGDS